MDSAKSIQYKFNMDFGEKMKEVIFDIIKGNYSSIFFLYIIISYHYAVNRSEAVQFQTDCYSHLIVFFWLIVLQLFFLIKTYILIMSINFF